MKKKLSKIGFAAVSLLPSVVAAAEIPGGVDPIAGNANLTLVDVIQNAITYILGFAAAIAVLFLIIGGIRYMASQGNAEATEAAKHTILYSVIGLLVIVLSFIIVIFISEQLAPAVAK